MNATNKTNDQLAAELQEQIRRFGLHDTSSNCNGLVAYADDGEEDYAAGTSRLDGDGGDGSLVDAAATLANLRAAVPCGDFDADQETFYGCVVAK